MKKNIIKNRKTKTLILQCLYSWYITNVELNLLFNFLFEKNNINRFFLNKFIYFSSNIIKKDKILTAILYKNYHVFLNIDLLEVIILKIVIFEFFFNRKISINVVISDALYLSNKFCTKSSYTIMKTALNDVLISYMIFNLIAR